MDALRNQIIERQAIDLITEEANFTETDMPEDEDNDTFALSAAISGVAPVSRPAEENEAEQDETEQDEAGEAEVKDATTDEVEETEAEASDGESDE